MATEKSFFEMVDVFPEGGRPIHRIPSLVVAPGGTVLAFADRRKTGRGDWGQETDVVIKRSLDGGRTWGAMQTLATAENVNMHSGPTAVDEQTGRVLKFHRYRPIGIKQSEDVAEDFDRWVKEGYGNFIIHSDDDGATWSPPRRMNLEFPEKHRVGNGVHGVQIEDGRLLINGGSHKGVADSLKSFLFSSDDHGETWHPSGAGQADGVVIEAATVVLADGNIMENHRTMGARRRVSIYGAGGTRLVDTYLDDVLPEPFCHASLARYSFASDDGADRILFANPPNPPPEGERKGARANITMRLSEDDGKTWPTARCLFPGPSGYSDTAVLPDMTILCLFENGDAKYNDRLSCARLNLAWLKEDGER